MNILQRNNILSRFQGAMLFSAVGDALGWPTEFGYYPPSVSIESNQKFRIQQYVKWEKRQLGGRWWGYSETIQAGSYSDDTQLNLSTARCIDSQGAFNVEKFSYFELPLWLVYEQGGGASVKLAARSLVSSRKEWWRNFYRRKSEDAPLEYRNAGANGAAMRVLPIALVNTFDEKKLFYEAFISSIVTHGHPRAILSTLIYAGAISFLVQRESFTFTEFVEYIKHVIQFSTGPAQNWEKLPEWLQEWNKKAGLGQTFQELFQAVRNEANEYLLAIPNYLNTSTNSYYKYIGALDKQTKGSGIATVMAAIYLFSKYFDQPDEAVFTAVNTLGSDTDTIANFVGGLFGAFYGLSSVPQFLIDGLQDKDYIFNTARQLHKIASGEALAEHVTSESPSRKDLLLRILAWEIGLHEMFWEALGEGDRLTHPSLGTGIITRKDIKPLPRDDYEVKLIGIHFDCGQTCTFHSRVSKYGQVKESLAKELKDGLGDSSLDFD